MVDREDKPKATVHLLPLARKRGADAAGRARAPRPDPMQDALQRLAATTAELQARTEHLLDANAKIGEDIAEVSLGLILHDRVGRILSQTCDSLTDLRSCVEECQELLQGQPSSAGRVGGK